MGKNLDYVVQTTHAYIEQMPKSKRKTAGQFFTSPETAAFMAGLFTQADSSGTESLSVLDPGAGTGILSAALVERLQSVPGLRRICLTCYETDSGVLDVLNANLEWIKRHSRVSVVSRIIRADYLTSQAAEYNHLLGSDPAPGKYDLVIGNPPYKKIARQAPEARALPDVCYGAPNLYFLFAAMGLFNLRPEGELVFILPRSWTSGAYFARFRRAFLHKGAIEHLHLFISRDKVFDCENVLQETMIMRVRKTAIRPTSVAVTTTQTNRGFTEMTRFEAPYDAVVAGSNDYVYLITNPREAEAVSRINQLRDTLPGLGLRMRTGLTVDFRHREDLRSQAEKGAVPLFYANHIKDGHVEFPSGRENEYLRPSRSSLLQTNSNYLFVKRFTSKEERRRLQCGVYLSRRNPDYPLISTQNKINFVCGRQALSEPVVYGLYVLFNSALYDLYYRILNGSTQVNATEMNAMPVPSAAAIEAMGQDLMLKQDMSEECCNRILEQYV